jgi:transcriptional regulator with XRE-family HTH domain
MKSQHHDGLYLSIGRKLKLLRMFPAYKKLATVATETGIDKAVLSKIENGKYRSLTVDMIATMCEHYHFPIESLFSDKDTQSIITV